MRLILLSGLREARRNLRRTFALAALIAIALAGALGLWAVEMVVDRELERSFASTRPASVVLQTTDVDPTLVRQVADLEGVVAADGRATHEARVVSKDGSLVPLVLIVAADPELTSVNRFEVVSSVEGDGAPAIWIESGSLDVIGGEPGDEVVVVAGGRRTSVGFGETIDEGIPPGTQGLRVFAHADPAAAKAMGFSPKLDELRVAVEPGVDSRGVLEDATAVVVGSGRVVSFSSAADVPRHPQTTQMSSVVTTTRWFAFLTALAAALLIAQVAAGVAFAARRQLAIFSLVGAGLRPLLGRQLAVFALPTVIGVALGLPLALWFGGAVSRLTLSVLSIQPASMLPPIAAIAWATLATLALIVTAVALPTWLGGIRSVRSELSQAPEGAALSRRIAGGIGSGLAALPVRSLLRRPIRTVVMVAALALAGSMVLTGFNLMAGWGQAADDEVSRRDFDIVIRLDPTLGDEVREVVEATPGVTGSETWGQIALGNAPNPHAPTGDIGSLVAVGSDSGVLRTPLVSGRWFRGVDEPDAVVLDERLARSLGAGLGDRVTLPVFGVELTYEVVGVATSALGGVREGFVALEAIRDRLGFPNLSNLVYVETAGAGEEEQRAIAEAIDDALRDAGIGVLGVRSARDERDIIANHVLPLVLILLVLAFLAAVIASVGVGVNGEISVQERRREIAVMRLLGASSGRLAGLLAAEAAIATALAALIAVPLGLVISRLVAGPVGEALLGRSVPVSIEVVPVLAWTVLSVLVAAAAMSLATNSLIDKPLTTEVTE